MSKKNHKEIEKELEFINKKLKSFFCEEHHIMKDPDGFNNSILEKFYREHFLVKCDIDASSGIVIFTSKDDFNDENSLEILKHIQSFGDVKEVRICTENNLFLAMKNIHPYSEDRPISEKNKKLFYNDFEIIWKYRQKLKEIMFLKDENIIF